MAQPKSKPLLEAAISSVHKQIQVLREEHQQISIDLDMRPRRSQKPSVTKLDKWYNSPQCDRSLGTITVLEITAIVLKSSLNIDQLKP